MRRRDVIALLGSSAAMVPFETLAQSARTPVIGFMSSRSFADSARLVEAFREGLAQGGYVEGRSVEVEYRWANGRYERLPGIAAELASRQVAAIVTVGGEPAVFAAKAASSVIPIIFSVGADPVEIGLVESFSRPGGNVTGVSILSGHIAGKRFELLLEAVRHPALIGVLVNPGRATADLQVREIEDAARATGRRVLMLNAGTESKLEAAFARLVGERAEALLIAGDPFFDTQLARIVDFATRQRLPAIYQFRDFALAGGLMSYGVNVTTAYRQLGMYAARILSGAKPADLPVVRTAEFELVINLRTAKALGLRVPASLLARATELIE
jgi:putative ABC transport system substrate-binding protein